MLKTCAFFGLKIFPHIFKILSFCVSLCEFYKISKDTLHVPYSCKNFLAITFLQQTASFFLAGFWQTENERNFLPIFLPYMKAMSARSVSVLLASRATLWVRCLASLFYLYVFLIICAGILEQSMGARNRVGIGLLYRPARARICKAFKENRNRFPFDSGYIGWHGGVDSAESISGLIKSLKIPSLLFNLCQNSSCSKLNFIAHIHIFSANIFHTFLVLFYLIFYWTF